LCEVLVIFACTPHGCSVCSRRMRTLVHLMPGREPLSEPAHGLSLCMLSNGSARSPACCTILRIVLVRFRLGTRKGAGESSLPVHGPRPVSRLSLAVSTESYGLRRSRSATLPGSESMVDSYRVGPRPPESRSAPLCYLWLPIPRWWGAGSNGPGGGSTGSPSGPRDRCNSP
jgi:hypothetical protein